MLSCSSSCYYLGFSEHVDGIVHVITSVPPSNHMKFPTPLDPRGHPKGCPAPQGVPQGVPAAENKSTQSVGRPQPISALLQMVSDICRMTASADGFATDIGHQSSDTTAKLTDSYFNTHTHTLALAPAHLRISGVHSEKPAFPHNGSSVLARSTPFFSRRRRARVPKHTMSMPRRRVAHRGEGACGMCGPRVCNPDRWARTHARTRERRRRRRRRQHMRRLICIIMHTRKTRFCLCVWLVFGWPGLAWPGPARPWLRGSVAPRPRLGYDYYECDYDAA